jgi:hypothetical protein
VSAAAIVPMCPPCDDATLARWRAAGADHATIAFCAAFRQLDAIIDANRRRHPHLVIASFPKAASTYLHRALVAVTGFRPYLLCTAGHDNERNIEPQAIPMFLAQPTVSQEHMRATRPNIHWLQRMVIRPVVLVRNLFDTVVSSADHAMQESIIGPNAHVPGTFRDWPREAQLDFIVRMGAPWYLTFFASWCDAAHELDVLWITYDDVVHDTPATLERVLAHSRAPLDRVVLEARWSPPDLGETRFNCGRAGRGASELSRSQQDALRSLAAVYRGSYDFSRIGL